MEFQSTYEKQLYWYNIGVQNSGSSSTEKILDICPSCGDERHLYMNITTGLWDCKKCGEHGNWAQFRQKLWDEKTLLTVDEDELEKLAEERGLPKEALISEENNWSLANIGDWWYLAYRGVRGEIACVKRRVGLEKGSKLTMGAGERTALFNIKDLERAGLLDTVWLCEGEWNKKRTDNKRFIVPLYSLKNADVL